MADSSISQTTFTFNPKLWNVEVSNEKIND